MQCGKSPVWLVWYVPCPKTGQMLKMGPVRCGSTEDAIAYANQIFCQPHPAWIESGSGEVLKTLNMDSVAVFTDAKVEEVLVA